MFSDYIDDTYVLDDLYGNYTFTGDYLKTNIYILEYLVTSFLPHHELRLTVDKSELKEGT
ncbi:MAG: hypothetical protein GF350_07030 [Chitinivibrionales bacterium]|nr:hypothetical protein [Chitinivibrionales bacterium]